MSLLDQPENDGQREASNVDHLAFTRISQAHWAEVKKLGAAPLGEKAIEKWERKVAKIDAKYSHKRSQPWANVRTLERLGLDPELAKALRKRLDRI